MVIKFSESENKKNLTIDKSLFYLDKKSLEMKTISSNAKIPFRTKMN